MEIKLQIAQAHGHANTVIREHKDNANTCLWDIWLKKSPYGTPWLCTICANGGTVDIGAISSGGTSELYHR
jgi:hypothetical protein